MPLGRESNRNWFPVLGLIVLTLIAYWGLNEHSFINYDDDVYVTSNTQVQTGISWSNVAWAFTSTSAANWHPFTWVSHMLDCQLFGLNPAGHHLTSLVIHIANVLLLYWLLLLTTGAVWQSALVSALFAIHPINVESVAWVAERKNVLSTLLWLITTLAYVWYARKPDLKRYLVVFVSFAGAVMCKPMVVTLPFTLLLLDYWPLYRLKQPATVAAEEKPRMSKRRSKQSEVNQRYPTRTVAQLLLEKAPLLLLVAGSIILTLKAQQSGGAVASLETFPLLVRLENALVSYVVYLRDLIWPFQLAIFYPHPAQLLPVWQVVLSLLVLSGVSALVVLLAKRTRYLPVGWFWYLGTLIPVIGIVQVGLQSRADRYAYIPVIGIFVMAIWSAFDWAKGRRSRVTIVGFCGAAALAVLGVTTRVQSSYWQNSITIFQHDLSVTRRNYVAYNNLGELYAQQGRLDEAAEQFASALEINPRFAHARHNMGMMLVQRDKLDEAIAEFSKAVEIDPKFVDAYNKLGAALASKARLDEAAANFLKAIEINPKYASAYANLGSVYEQQGKTEQAVASYSDAIKFTANSNMSAQTHFRLGRLLGRTGRRSEARDHYREALRLKPDYPQAQQALDKVIADQDQGAPNRKVN